MSCWSGASWPTPTASTARITSRRAACRPGRARRWSSIAKILGPRGLMPNPKVGTVTKDIAKAVKDQKAGAVEFRVEKAGIVHAPIGRLSFEATQLRENLNALLDQIVRLKPAAAKGKYVLGISVSSTGV